MAVTWNRIKELPEALRYAAALLLTLAFLTLYTLIFGSGHPYLVGLFPVILCAVFLRGGPGLVSLVITAAFINRYEAHSESIVTHTLAVVLFLAEGLAVIWIAEKRRLAQLHLAEALRRRDQELKELQIAHDKLTDTATNHDQSIEKLKRSNELMLDTLERILGKSNR